MITLRHRFSATALTWLCAAVSALVLPTAQSAVAAGGGVVHEVLVGDHYFEPEHVVAQSGDTIRWIWVEGFHTATSGEDCLPDDMFAFVLASFSPIGEYEIPADFVGDIPYFCEPHCDMGQLGLITVEPSCGPNGDLNCDGVVNGADLAILLGNWGDCEDPADCPADLNGDGVVNGADLAILLGNWGQR